MAEQTPEESRLNDEADKHLESIGESMSRRGRSTLRRAVVVNGIRVALNAERDRKAPTEDFGPLPDKVKELTRACKRVYAMIRDARAKPGGDQTVLGSAEIEQRIRTETPNDDLDITTVRHALKALRDADAVRNIPASGYFCGAEQPALPFVAGQPGPLPDGSGAG